MEIQSSSQVKTRNPQNIYGASLVLNLWGYSKAPELFCGLQNLSWLSISMEGHCKETPSQVELLSSASKVSQKWK